MRLPLIQTKRFPLQLHIWGAKHELTFITRLAVTGDGMRSSLTAVVHQNRIYKTRWSWPLTVQLHSEVTNSSHKAVHKLMPCVERNKITVGQRIMEKKSNNYLTSWIKRLKSVTFSFKHQLLSVPITEVAISTMLLYYYYYCRKCDFHVSFLF